MKAMHNRSLLINYMISYIGIVVFSCAVFTLVFMGMYIKDLQQKHEQSLHEKSALAVADMEKQFENLHRLAITISTQKVYSPSYFNSNKYYEIELLKDYARYQTHSPISGEYFLMYRDRDVVFHSSAYTRNTANYMSTMGVEQMPEFFSDYPGNRSMQVMIFPELDFSFVVFPLDTISGEEAVQCFVVYNKDLRMRIQNVTGGLEGHYTLYYGDQMLLSDTVSGQQGEGRMRQLSVHSTDGMWGVQLSYADQLNRASAFQALGIVLLVAAVLLSLGIAAYAAYINYRPIKRLAARYNAEPMLAGVPKNELHKIDAQFQRYRQDASRTNENMLRQKNLLRSQMLRLLLNGDYTQEMEYHLSELNITLLGPLYSVYAVMLLGEAASDEVMEEAARLVEDLSDEEVRLYPLQGTGKGQIIILASLAEKRLHQETEEMLRELFTAQGYDFALGHGNVYDSPLRFPAAHLDVLSDLNSQINAHDRHERSAKGEDCADDPTCYNGVAVSQMLMAIEEGNKSLALLSLEHFLSELEETERPPLILRYIFSDILTRFVQAGRQVGVPVAENHISLILTAGSVSAFREGATMLTGYLCDKVREKEQRITQDTAYRVMDYIRHNYWDYELSIEKTARDLGLAINRISEIVKDQTGQNYKNYIIMLRMELARELLINQNMAVQEVCTKVGYANISHFIKTFKSHTGVTPGAYQRSPQIAQSAHGESCV